MKGGVVMQKKWKKPELTILVRGETEGAVLQACKNGGGGGASDTWNACSEADGGYIGSSCKNCSDLASA